MDKARERFFLDKFLELRPDLSLANIRDSEAPDFLAMFEGREIGVELVQFVFPSNGGISQQAVENYRSQLTTALKEQHLARGVPPVTVSLHLDTHEPLMTRAGRDTLAAILLDFVSARIPPAGRHVDYDWDQLPTALTDRGVSHLSILRHPSLTIPFWTVPHASFLPESTGAVVQTVIDRKSANRASYLTKAPEHWLLIISGTQGLHSILDFDRDVLTTEYPAAFERLFLFRTFGPSAHELKVRKVLS